MTACRLPQFTFRFTLRPPSSTTYAVTQIVAPKPEFLALNEQAVLVALDHLDPANPIAMEVTRLVATYTTNFKNHVERLGYMPTDIIHIKPRWPIEAVAMRLTMDVICDSHVRRGSSNA